MGDPFIVCVSAPHTHPTRHCIFSLVCRASFHSATCVLFVCGGSLEWLGGALAGNDLRSGFDFTGERVNG